MRFVADERTELRTRLEALNALERVAGLRVRERRPFAPQIARFAYRELSALTGDVPSNYRDGRDCEFENISTVITLRTRLRSNASGRVSGSDKLTAIAIRATTVLRREDGTWKVTHRHGDQITTMRSANSELERRPDRASMSSSVRRSVPP